MDWLRLFTPSAWNQNEPTSLEWDKRLNYLLDNYEIVVEGNYTIKINGVEVWISNYPYSYGKTYHNEAFGQVLPTLKTRQRLKTAVEQIAIKEFDEKYLNKGTKIKWNI